MSHVGLNLLPPFPQHLKSLPALIYSPGCFEPHSLAHLAVGTWAAFQILGKAKIVPLQGLHELFL